MLPDSKQCRACCNLNSILTTGYLSYLNERKEVNLYIQLAYLDCVGLLVILIDLMGRVNMD
jgi:accessory gene regulator protein AgrB